MYRLKFPNDGRDSAYAKLYAPKLQKIILEYLKDGRKCTVTFRNGNKVDIGLGEKSITRTFLNKLSNLDQLEKWLLMRPNDQIGYIGKMQKWKVDNNILFRGLNHSLYTSLFKGHPDCIDHFNEIMYDIFVVNGYENKQEVTGFDKMQFIKDSELSVCPYCSEEEIEPTQSTKKQIDHFLPKRQYPFFAMNFYNLIPSCGTCNDIGNKGTNDPLLSKNGIKDAIVNPYSFNPEWIRYHLKLLKAEPFNNDDFELVLGFKTIPLLEGYNEFFDISDRQARHKNVAAADYRRLMKFKAEHYYEGMRIDRDWLNNAYGSVLAFDPKEDMPEKEVHHRMRHDVFEQYTNQRKSGFFYTKQSAGNIVELA